MALDVMQMVKRSDVYYHLKASTSATDCLPQSPMVAPGVGRKRATIEIAFYSNVPGLFSIDGAKFKSEKFDINRRIPDAREHRHAC